MTPGINPRHGAATSFGNNENVINGGVGIKPPKASQQPSSIQHTRAGSTIGPQNPKPRKAKVSQSTAKGSASLNAYLVSNH